MHCPNCRSAVAAGQSFCAKCGAKLDAAGAAPGSSIGPSLSPAVTETPYSGFWRRAAAILIDFAILVLVYALLLLLAPEALKTGIPQLLFALALWLYFAGMESSKFQATIGKQALRIKATDLHGQRLGFGRATGRHFA